MEPPLVIDEDYDVSNSQKSMSDLLCQGCRKNKAFFMCAGCSRQWYCSKECQVSINLQLDTINSFNVQFSQEHAWDEHAEKCVNI